MTTTDNNELPNGIVWDELPEIQKNHGRLSIITPDVVAAMQSQPGRTLRIRSYAMGGTASKIAAMFKARFRDEGLRFASRKIGPNEYAVYGWYEGDKSA